MANFTIHELYESMRGDVTPLDYRNKDRDDWTAWDWLCALKDVLKGDAAGSRADIIYQMKADLQALFNARNELPGLTEAQMMVKYGTTMRELLLHLTDEPIQADFPSLSENELELINDATSRLDPDSEETSRAGLRQDRFSRFRKNVSDYTVRLIHERRALEAQNNPNNQDRIVALAARMYVAGNLARGLQNRAGRGFPEIFNEEEIGRLADSMLASDENFRNAVMNTVINNDFPDFGLQPAGQPQSDQVLRQVGQHLLQESNHIQELAPNNLMLQDPGADPLSPEKTALRLALLKDVKAKLDATGTGHDWRHWFSRPANSPEYEAVRTEVNRQISRLEAGLPVGEADRQRMMQALNTYTAGKEAPGSGFGKTRQNNMLRLYAEYSNEEERPAVMHRYNRVRGTQDIHDRDHINLERAPYRILPQNLPGTALAQYNRALADLQTQYNRTLASGRPMNEAEQFALQQTVMRLAALREIMAKSRTGAATLIREEDILAAQARIEQDPHNPVPGAIAPAARDTRTFNELLSLFSQEAQNEEANVSHLAGNYYRDPARYEDPLAGKIRTLSYPTIGQLYQNTRERLAALELPAQGAMSEQQADEYRRLTRQLFTYKQVMAARGSQYHLSTSRQQEFLRVMTGASRIDEALGRAAADAEKARRYRDVLLDDAVPVPVLNDRTDRYANGYIWEAAAEAQDFFNQIQVPENDPALTEQDKQQLRDQFVRLAALNNLANRRVRNGRFPERIFQSERLFSTEDVEAAMEDVRQNQPAFMQAIEAGLNTAGSVRRLASSLASHRYLRGLEGIRADIAALSAVPYNNAAEQPDTARLRRSTGRRNGTREALRRISGRGADDTGR